MSKKDALEKKEKEELAAGAYDYGESAGQGLEDVSSEEMAMAFMTVLQKGSPQVDEDSDTKMEGAKAGMFYNSVSNELFDGQQGIRGVACHRVFQYIEWKPDRGGFVAVHTPGSEVVANAMAEAKQLEESKGMPFNPKFAKLKVGENDLIKTFTVYWIFLAEGSDEVIGQAVSSYKSTAITPYQKMITRANQIRINGKVPPLYAHVYRLKTVLESRDKGSSYNWKIDYDGENAVACRLAPDSPVFKAADEFHKLASSGGAKVDYAQDADGKTSADDEPAF